MRIGSTTQRGIAVVAFTTALALLSFLLLRTACWPDLHATHGDEHSHAAAPLVSPHGPADHCHHHDAPVPHNDVLDQALQRTHDRTAQLAPVQSPSVGVPDAPVLEEHHTGPGRSTGGPPRPGRALLIVLSVARN
ncbi:hypothetical protein ABZ345_17705 [Lentzea sp. NPDC005914]|uniref:hypothetical protein n=1 Tax=Lentzea sp. NPDC005914 TaxID=3154572 RepID=UPI0033F3F35C